MRKYYAEVYFEYRSFSRRSVVACIGESFYHRLGQARTHSRFWGRREGFCDLQSCLQLFRPQAHKGEHALTDRAGLRDDPPKLKTFSPVVSSWTEDVIVQPSFGLFPSGSAISSRRTCMYDEAFKGWRWLQQTRVCRPRNLVNSCFFFRSQVQRGGVD